MEAKHTVGPWEIRECGLITAGKCGLHIAETATTGMGKTGDANASLIAAAPELLEALKSAKEYLQEMGDRYPGPLLDKIDAAIAKAEGGR